MTVRVIKVGGSLLDWPELGPALWQWLQSQPPGKNYLLSGGGALADAIRQADLAHQLGEEVSHQLCLEVMGITGKVLQRIVAKAKEAAGDTVDTQRHISVLDVPLLLQEESIISRVGQALPYSWDVSSDSIAAYLATAFGAHELVLLKSAPLPGSMTYEEASALDYADRFFPTAAKQVRKVRAVNLRVAPPNEWMLFASPFIVRG